MCMSASIILSTVQYTSADQQRDQELQKLSSQYIMIDKRLEGLFAILDTKDYIFQERFYKRLKEVFSEKKILIINTDTLELLVYIESRVDEKHSEYIQKHQELVNKENNNTDITINTHRDSSENSDNIVKSNMSKHQTLILSFWKWWNHIGVIENNKQAIQNAQSVFIFRKLQDITSGEMKTISKKLKEMNPEIHIFIDQEWWWINRYLEFGTPAEVNHYFSNSTDIFLTSRYSQLTQAEITKIRNMFPQYAWYYPSLEKIGKIYDTFSTEKQRIYLEILAYIRLKTLLNNGINTYWLVADLNRWNTVIWWNARSFSRHVFKYKNLIDAFVKASEQTGVMLYLKHFPGHGTGWVDTHKWVLSLVWKEAYLKDNLDVFEYFITHKWYGKNTVKGLMIGHMYIPNSVLPQFDRIIEQTDFLLTDDLGMQWYKLATNRPKSGLFFTTDRIYSSNKLIIVDTITAHTVE